MIGALRTTKDESLIRALRESMASIANEQVVTELVAAYSQFDDPRVRLRLGIVHGSIHNPDAAPALLSLAGTEAEALTGPLAHFAVDALARIGTAEAAAFLLEKLQNASAVDESTLIHAIGMISGEAALPILRSAAATNGSTLVRTAAILALGNYEPETVLPILASLSRPDLPSEELHALELASSKIRARVR